MTIDAFEQIQVIRQEDIASYNDFFARNILFDRAVLDRVWNALEEQFRPMNELQQFEYKQTYFGWFTQLTWKKLANLEEEFFLEEVVAKQIPTAYFKDVPVLDQLLWYIQYHSYEEYTQELLYTQVLDRLKDSSAVIGKDKQGNHVLFKDLLVNFQRVYTKDQPNSMHIAQLYSEFRQEFFGGIDVSLERPELLTENVSDNFFSFLKFITDISPEDVPYMIDMRTDPFKNDILKESQSQPSVAQQSTTTATTQEPEPEQTPSPIDQKPQTTTPSFFDDLANHQNDFIDWIQQEQTRSRLVEQLQKETDAAMARTRLAKELQQYFPDIHEDIDIAGAIVELDNYLKEQGIDGEDLLYFDDNDAGFHWHDTNSAL